MTRSLSFTLSICATALTVALLFVCWKLSAALDTTRQAAWNVSALAWNSQPTVQHVNEATDVWAQASKKQAAAADELIRDLRVEAWHLDKTMTNVNDQVRHVGPLLDSVKELADAGTGTAQAATKTIQTTGTTIQGFQPLLANANQSVVRFNALLDSKDLTEGMAHANGILAHTETITGNVAEVSTKAKNDYMKARTPWGRFATTGLDLIHLGAYAAR